MPSAAAGIHGVGHLATLTLHDASSDIDPEAFFFWTDVENNSRGPDSMKTLSIDYRSRQLGKTAFVRLHDVTNGEWMRDQDLPHIWDAILAWRPPHPTYRQSPGHSQPAKRPPMTPPKRTIPLAENLSQQQRCKRPSRPEALDSAEALLKVHRLGVCGMEARSETAAPPSEDRRIGRATFRLTFR